MVEPKTKLTEPILSAESVVHFSAYGLGWGYCAFALPPEVVCQQLGAANGTGRQLLLAFALGKRRVLQVVERVTQAKTGERITLSTADFLWLS
jgi:hypothetical protein